MLLLSSLIDWTLIEILKTSLFWEGYLNISTPENRDVQIISQQNEHNIQTNE